MTSFVHGCSHMHVLPIRELNTQLQYVLFGENCQVTTSDPCQFSGKYCNSWLPFVNKIIYDQHKKP
jgi:hypothetical protein